MTPAEIVKSLRCCAEIGECEKCPIDAEATWDDCRKRDVLSKYFVAFRDAVGPIVDTARYFPSDGWTCDNWDVPQKLISHWMPLPKEPEAHNGKENS